MAKKSYSKAALEALLPGLQNAGCPVGVKDGKDDASALIKVAQDHEGSSWIGVNNAGLTYCMLWVSICIRCTQIAIRGYKVILPWEDPTFFVLLDPRETDASARTYRFFCGGEEYSRDLVLNHRIGRFTRGKSIDGALMGVSKTRIPAQYTHGSDAELKLSVITSLGECSTSIVARIDRSQEWYPRKAKRRTPLFARTGDSAADFPLHDDAEKRGIGQK